jgi:glycosyltransferase involved in cell wall biosynthesis
MGCRLLYVIGDLTCGGAEYQLYLLLKSMDRDRFRPQVVVWSFREHDRYVSLFSTLDIPLHCFPPTLSVFAKIQRLRRLIFELNPEVLHSYSFYLNVAARCATFLTSTIAIGSVRSDFLRDKSDSGLLIGSLSARWPRNQICNSLTALKAAKQSRSPFTPERLFVIRNGFDLNRIRWCPIPSATRVSILGIGSLILHKRWDRLLTVASELKKRKFDFSVRIVGDGPLRQALEEQTRSLDVDDHVQFLGQSNDIPGLLAESTILAHTSDVEGCPNVVMEAMASGRPVVTTDAGDAPFLVEDGKTGFVVRRGDSKTLVESLAALIGDSSLCRSMGEAGRAKAVREFSLDRLVSETLTAYEAVGWRR